MWFPQKDGTTIISKPQVLPFSTMIGCYKFSAEKEKEHKNKAIYRCVDISEIHDKRFRQGDSK
jgi:hypothetical protein